jgi:hypothetical protein
MMERYEGYWISGSAVPGPPNTCYWESLGSVLKDGPRGQSSKSCGSKTRVSLSISPDWPHGTRWKLAGCSLTTAWLRLDELPLGVIRFSPGEFADRVTRARPLLFVDDYSKTRFFMFYECFYFPSGTSDNLLYFVFGSQKVVKPRSYNIPMANSNSQLTRHSSSSAV